MLNNITHVQLQTSCRIVDKIRVKGKSVCVVVRKYCLKNEHRKAKQSKDPTLLC